MSWTPQNELPERLTEWYSKYPLPSPPLPLHSALQAANLQKTQPGITDERKPSGYRNYLHNLHVLFWLTTDNFKFYVLDKIIFPTRRPGRSHPKATIRVQVQPCPRYPWIETLSRQTIWLDWTNNSKIVELPNMSQKICWSTFSCNQNGFVSNVHSALRWRVLTLCQPWP